MPDVILTAWGPVEDARPELAGLLVVEPFTGDTPESFGLRACDLCGDCPVMDGPDVRAIYYDPLERLSVCERCVEDYLAEKP